MARIGVQLAILARTSHTVCLLDLSKYLSHLFLIRRLYFLPASHFRVMMSQLLISTSFVFAAVALCDRVPAVWPLASVGEPAKLPYVYGLSYIYRSHGSQGLVHISCIARTYRVGCKLHGTQVVRTNTTFWLGQKGGRNKLLSVRHRHFSTQRSKPCICAKPKSIASLLSGNIAGTLRLLFSRIVGRCTCRGSMGPPANSVAYC